MLGDDPELLAYFRHDVVGGDAAFVMRGVAAEPLTDLMRMKFLRDLIAARDKGRGPGAITPPP